jgi:predicted dehydrogenase
MRYENGALAQVTSSVVHHGEEQQIIFHGEKARVSAPWRAVSQKSQPNGHPVPAPENVKELDEYYKTLPTVAYEGHTGQIDDVLKAIEMGGEPMITGYDGRRTLELITAIYKAGTEKTTVTLPIAKDDAFYTVEGILGAAPRFYEKTNSADDLYGEITFGSNYDKY